MKNQQIKILYREVIGMVFKTYVTGAKKRIERTNEKEQKMVSRTTKIKVLNERLRILSKALY